MIDMRRFFTLSATVMLMASCGTMSEITRESQYALMYEDMPAVLLVMPPINNTSNVEAKDLLYTSISKPLAEAGYYIISPLLAMDVLRQESAYDSELFKESSLETFKKYFGADAVVFSEINAWNKAGFGIETEIRYFIRSATTGEIIFDRSCDLYLDLQSKSNSSGKSVLGPLLDLAVSVISTAVTDHIVAARKANNFIFRDIPRGKYSPAYLQDKSVVAELKDIKMRVK